MCDFLSTFSVDFIHRDDTEPFCVIKKNQEQVAKLSMCAKEGPYSIPAPVYAECRAVLARGFYGRKHTRYYTFDFRGELEINYSNIEFDVNPVANIYHKGVQVDQVSIGTPSILLNEEMNARVQHELQKNRERGFFQQDAKVRAEFKADREAYALRKKARAEFEAAKEPLVKKLAELEAARKALALSEKKFAELEAARKALVLRMRVAREKKLAGLRPILLQRYDEAAAHASEYEQEEVELKSHAAEIHALVQSSRDGCFQKNIPEIHKLVRKVLYDNVLAHGKIRQALWQHFAIDDNIVNEICEMLSSEEAETLRSAVLVCEKGKGTLTGTPLNAALSGVYALQRRASLGDAFRKEFNDAREAYWAQKKPQNMRKSIDWSIALAAAIGDSSHLGVWEECVAKLVQHDELLPIFKLPKGKAVWKTDVASIYNAALEATARIMCMFSKRSDGNEFTYTCAELHDVLFGKEITQRKADVCLTVMYDSRTFEPDKVVEEIAYGLHEFGITACGRAPQQIPNEVIILANIVHQTVMEHYHTVFPRNLAPWVFKMQHHARHITQQMLIYSLFNLGIDTKEEPTKYAPEFPSKGALMYTVDKIFGSMIPLCDVKTIYAASNRTECLNVCIVHIGLSKLIDADATLRCHEGRIAFNAWRGEGLMCGKLTSTGIRQALGYISLLKKKWEDLSKQKTQWEALLDKKQKESMVLDHIKSYIESLGDYEVSMRAEIAKLDLESIVIVKKAKKVPPPPPAQQPGAPIILMMSSKDDKSMSSTVKEYDSALQQLNDASAALQEARDKTGTLRYGGSEETPETIVGERKALLANIADLTKKLEAIPKDQLREEAKAMQENAGQKPPVKVQAQPAPVPKPKEGPKSDFQKRIEARLAQLDNEAPVKQVQAQPAPVPKPKEGPKSDFQKRIEARLAQLNFSTKQE